MKSSSAQYRSTTLVDSPVSAGAHYKTIDLGTFDGAPHYIHIAADSERALAMHAAGSRAVSEADRGSGRDVRRRATTAAIIFC